MDVAKLRAGVFRRFFLSVVETKRIYKKTHYPSDLVNVQLLWGAECSIVAQRLQGRRWWPAEVTRQDRMAE